MLAITHHHACRLRFSLPDAWTVRIDRNPLQLHGHKSVSNAESASTQHSSAHHDTRTLLTALRDVAATTAPATNKGTIALEITLPTTQEAPAHVRVCQVSTAKQCLQGKLAQL